MGLLDGDLKRVFGNAFGPRLLPAVLHKYAIVENEDGTISKPSPPTDYAIRAMVDKIDKVFDEEQGRVKTTVSLIVLQHNVPVVPEEHDEITINRDAKTYVLGAWTEDPAQAAWTIAGTPK